VDPESAIDGLMNKAQTYRFSNDFGWALKASLETVPKKLT
jgi:hypothetical protein